MKLKQEGHSHAKTPRKTQRRKEELRPSLIENQVNAGPELKGPAGLRAGYLLVDLSVVRVDLILLVRVRDDDGLRRRRHPPVISHAAKVAEIPRQRPVIGTHDRDSRFITAVLLRDPLDLINQIE